MKEIFWDTLGIAPTTDTKKIRKAYSGLVKQHNPEDDEEAFRKINQAYRAAMNFARQMSALNISDDQIVITDRREDGSFNIQVKKENVLPGPIAPVPSSSDEEEPKVQDAIFDFGDLDSSRVKELTIEEIDEMTGYLSLAPGFPVPDGQKARRIKKFIDDNDLINNLSGRVKPEEKQQGADDALRAAGLILNDESVREERIMWNFFFNSPKLLSLQTSYEFYSKFQKLTDDAGLSITAAQAMADVSLLRPRVYVKPHKPGQSEAKIDFLTKLPFRYGEGRYPEFDELMQNEDPREVKELIDFLEHSRINLYAMLMPKMHPVKKDALPDAVSSFYYILKNPDCTKIREKSAVWKLFFQGSLVKPMISDHDLHIGLTKSMLDMDLSKDLVKTMKKQIVKEPCFIRKKMGNKNSFFITFIDSEMRKDKNGKYVYIPYGQVTPWVQVFIGVVGLVFGLIMVILLAYMSIVGGS